jgi:hypothetical protein
MNKIRRVITLKGGRINVGARVSAEDWAQFKVKADSDGQSVAGRVSWLIMRDIAQKVVTKH